MRPCGARGHRSGDRVKRSGRREFTPLEPSKNARREADLDLGVAESPQHRRAAATPFQPEQNPCQRRFRQKWTSLGEDTGRAGPRAERMTASGAAIMPLNGQNGGSSDLWRVGRLRRHKLRSVSIERLDVSPSRSCAPAELRQLFDCPKPGCRTAPATWLISVMRGSTE
jgi:hypothetical protein